MSALTSLIHLSTVNWIDMFFVAVSEEEPFISHAEALVDALLDSNPEKQCFRALVELARAVTLLYYRHEVPDGFAHDIRTRLVRLLHAYSASSLLSVPRNVEMTCITGLASRIFSLPSLTHALSWPPMFPLCLSIGIIIR